MNKNLTFEKKKKTQLKPFMSLESNSECHLVPLDSRALELMYLQVWATNT